MKVLLAAFGTRGDVQPMLALAHGLRERGHDVTLGVPPNFVAWVESFGFRAHAVGLDYEAFMQEVGTNVPRALKVLRTEMSRQWDVLGPLAAAADVVVGSSVIAVGRIIVEHLKKPYRYVVFSPSLIPSAQHASPATTAQGLPRWLNRVTWWLNGVVWRLTFAKPLDAMRARLGLAPVQGDLWEYVLGEEVIVASEPVLTRPPPDAKLQVHQTGAWTLPERDALSPELEAFLNAGAPPVYIGFGSMADKRPHRTTRAIVEAVRRAGVRAIVSRGWAGFDAKASDSLLVIGSEPHGKLFPRCCAIVHHAGAGTTTAALRAGVPQIPVPHLLDQFFWAPRLVKLGVAPCVVPKSKLTAKSLTAAITSAISGPYRDRAQIVARECTTDGVARGVAIVESLLVTGSTAASAPSRAAGA